MSCLWSLCKPENHTLINKMCHGILNYLSRLPNILTVLIWVMESNVECTQTHTWSEKRGTINPYSQRSFGMSILVMSNRSRQLDLCNMCKDSVWLWSLVVWRGVKVIKWRVAFMSKLNKHLGTEDCNTTYHILSSFSPRVSHQICELIIDVNVHGI